MAGQLEMKTVVMMAAWKGEKKVGRRDSWMAVSLVMK